MIVPTKASHPIKVADITSQESPVFSLHETLLGTTLVAKLINYQVVFGFSFFSSVTNLQARNGGKL